LNQTPIRGLLSEKLTEYYSAYVKSNGEWIAKCIIQGFLLAPIEALPEISITDIVSATLVPRPSAFGRPQMLTFFL